MRRLRYIPLMMLALALAIAGRAAAQAPPNVVLIMADDLGYGDLSCYDGWIKTPRLDQLAAEGMRFTDFHSSGAVCSPTRAGLITGRYQQRVGIPGVVYADPKRPVHHDGIQDIEHTLPEAFKQLGYKTAMFGKSHLGFSPKFFPNHLGFDAYYGSLGNYPIGGTCVSRRK